MKITDIPVIFICPDHNDKYHRRKEHMFSILDKIGFKNVSMFKSGNESYPNCLSKATYDILSNNLNDDPVLILEDDIDITEWADFTKDFETPENTDAFYFGFSKHSASYDYPCTGGYWTVNIIHIDDKYIRIQNMLSTHAILYISKRYKEAVMNGMSYCLCQKEPIPSDVVIGRLHKDYIIYGLKYPFFYQSSDFGNTWYSPDATNFRF